VKTTPPGQMKALVQYLTSVRHACYLTFKHLLKSNCNSCPYCSDLNLLCYVSFLLTSVIWLIARETILWSFAILKKNCKANEFGELASLSLSFSYTSSHVQVILHLRLQVCWSQPSGEVHCLWSETDLGSYLPIPLTVWINKH
jgi:hypothetical protein